MTQVAAWFQLSTESLQVLGSAYPQAGEGERPPVIGSHVCPMIRNTCIALLKRCLSGGVQELGEPLVEELLMDWLDHFLTVVEPERLLGGTWGKSLVLFSGRGLQHRTTKSLLGESAQMSMCRS